MTTDSDINLCFWKECSNSKRCEAFGECVAGFQNRHKLAYAKIQIDRNAVLDEVKETVEDEMHEDYPSFDSLLRKIDNLRGDSDE